MAATGMKRSIEMNLKTANLTELKKMLKNGKKLAGAKCVGGITYKFWIEGEKEGYYIKGSESLLRLFAEHNVN